MSSFESANKNLYTVWGKRFDREDVLPEYPRPLMKRDSYVNLNGEWDYAFTSADHILPRDIEWMGKIVVPFSPEASLSGVLRQLKPNELLWYRRLVKLPKDYKKGMHLLLHFGAVDQICVVYINGERVKRHIGGYLPFYVDISTCTGNGKDEAEIVLSVRDKSESSFHSRGKQLLERGGMFYTAQSGIWKTVWMESVEKKYIRSYEIRQDAARGKVSFEIYLNTRVLEGEEAGELAEGKAEVKGSHKRRISFFSKDKLEIKVKKPYIDPAIAMDPELLKEEENKDRKDMKGYCPDIDFDILDREGILNTGLKIERLRFKKNVVYLDIRLKEKELWSPESPYLYYFRLKVFDDEIKGYFALRTLSIEKKGDHRSGVIGRLGDELLNHPRICLNHKAYFQNGVLDQGYWPEGLYTPPSDRALIYDILKMKELGYNMLRKHLKIEAERYYYHCDRFGMIVWQDMVNGGAKYNFWFVTYLATLFNTVRYRIFDDCYYLLSRKNKAGRIEFEREMKKTVKLLYNHPSICSFVIFNEGWGQFDAKRLTEELRAIDKSRIIDSASGWFDQGCGDVRSQHYYFMKLRVQWCLKRATVISEYGGFPYAVKEHAMYNKVYGYHNCNSMEELKEKYTRLMRKIIEPEIDKGLSAIVYTQLSDVEEEVNGILTYDREVCKFEGLQTLAGPAGV
ncbi:MAG: glycoside hydrolase family 2 [Lachnospiraceae bacterium]|nr:glycoside hydrolase family 2 [Lachnospiraceae bacterium]